MDFIMTNDKNPIFLLTLLLLACFLSIYSNYADLDLWHRLMVGSIFFNTGGGILYHDIFSYMPVKPLWVDHEWGSGVVFYFLRHYFGDAGLLLLKASSFFGVLALIWQANKLVSPKAFHNRFLFYFISAWGLFPAYLYTVRCHVFTYFFFTLWVLVLEKMRRGESGLLWIFPLTMIFWVNLHGGFVAGLGLMGIYAVGEVLNKKNPMRILTALGFTLPVTLLNPYGVEYWKYIIEAVTMPRPYITEWQSLDFSGSLHLLLGFKLLLLFTVLGWGYHWVQKDKGQKWDWVAIGLLIITFCLGVRHIRHTVFFVITASIFSFGLFELFFAACFGEYLAKFQSLFSKKKLALLSFTRSAFLFLFLFIGFIYGCFYTSLSLKIDDTWLPVKAVEHMKKSGIKGNLLVSFNWGSYAMYELYPQCLVSMDGRYEETYTNETYLEIYNFFYHKEGWREVLENYPHDIILIHVKSKTYKELMKMEDWEKTYQDEMAAIFVSR